MSFRLAVIGDDIEYRNGLIGSLHKDGGFDVCGVYDRAAKAIRGIPTLMPDMVIVDFDLPRDSGLRCIRELKNRFPQMEFVVLTNKIEDEVIFRALQMGAGGYISKVTPFAKVVDGIAEIKNGGAYISTQIARRILDHVRRFPIIPPETPRLSSREDEVVNLMAKGLSYKEIGDILYISVETVRRHVHHIYRKLHVRNRTEALAALRKRN